MLNRIHALWLLGTAMLLVLVKRLVGRGDPLTEFDEHYGAEGILAVSPEEHALLETPNRCTGCSACDDWGTPERRTNLRLFVLSGTRSLPDADAGRALLAGLSPEDLGEAEARCPEGVPIARLAELIVGHAKRRSANQA